MTLVCENCGKEFDFMGKKLKTCSKECLKKYRSKKQTEYLMSLSPEDRQKKAKQNAEKAKEGLENFRSRLKKDKEFAENYSDKISTIKKKQWESLSTEEKNERVRQIQLDHWKQDRSQLAGEIKQAMIMMGIVGFESEVVFKGKIPDEINHEKKLIVEVFGDVFHAHPSKFPNDTDWVSIKQMTAGEVRQKDADKIELFREAGYKTFIVWECEYHSNPQLVLENLRTWVTLNSE